MGRRRSVRDLQQALLIEPPPFLSNSYRSPAMLQGLRFEKRIKKFIDETYEDWVVRYTPGGEPTARKLSGLGRNDARGRR